MATGSLKRYIQFESQIKMIGCCCCVAVQGYLSLASRKALANGLYLIFRAVICTEKHRNIHILLRYFTLENKHSTSAVKC